MEQPQARFIARNRCISCSSDRLVKLSSGRFADEPLRSYIQGDPWGESPLPYLETQRWEFVRCGVCTQMFHRLILSPEWDEKRFTSWMTQDAMLDFGAVFDTPEYRFERASEHVTHALRLEKMTRMMRDGEVIRLLDFGCGWGEFVWMCSQFGFDACGIDRSVGRRSAALEGIQIYPEIDDLRNAPSSAKGFHVLTLFEVLEHLVDPLSVLNTLSELVLPGGILILETPDCMGTTGIDSQMDYRNIHPLDHINGFTPDTLRKIALRAGFRPAPLETAYATNDEMRVVKTRLKRWLGGFVRPTTRQYFRKT